MHGGQWRKSFNGDWCELMSFLDNLTLPYHYGVRTWRGCAKLQLLLGISHIYLYILILLLNIPFYP